MVKRKFRSQYDGIRVRVAQSFLDEEGNPANGRTEQCHKKDCDINNILRKYDKTGLITHVNTSKAHYGDYTEVNEYQNSLNMVIQAQDMFSELPAEIRKKFANDPGNFFEFVTNPDNLDEMVKLGLAEQQEKPLPVSVVIENNPDGIVAKSE